MKIPCCPHAWQVSSKEAIELQQKMARRVRFVPPKKSIRWVAGVDVAFSRDEKRCIAGVVLWDMREKRVVEQQVSSVPLTFPYVPGLLSFREAPAILKALQRLKKRPDVIICDGQGFAHPRRFGLACHLGIILNLSTVGCAKSILIGGHDILAQERGATVPLMDKNEIIGAVVRTRYKVKPVYISVGHLMDLETAVRVVLDCSIGFRLPEPTRLADRLVAKAKAY